MLCHQFSASSIHEPHEQYVWPTHGSLGPQDIQAISNLAGLAYNYGYDSGGATQSERAESVDFVGHGPQLHWYDVQHPQTISLHYGSAYELHSEQPSIQGSVHTTDDEYYYAGGLLSTHQFAGSTHTIETQTPCRQTMSSFSSDVLKNPVSGSDPEEPFSTTSLTPLSFSSATVDNPFDNIDSYLRINHDHILPNQRSTYSELSANLVYMTAEATRLEGEVLITPEREGALKRRKRDKAGSRVKSKDKQLKRGHEGAPLSPRSLPNKSKMERKGGRRRGRGTIEGDHLPTVERFKEENCGQEFPQTKHTPPPTGIGRTPTLPAGRPSSKKKLGLACLFCRERKIACGRPSESNPDQTCNQCARRFFQCEYPIESRRGQHKRPRGKPCAA